MGDRNGDFIVEETMQDKEKGQRELAQDEDSRRENRTVNGSDIHREEVTLAQAIEQRQEETEEEEKERTVFWDSELCKNMSVYLKQGNSARGTWPPWGLSSITERRVLNSIILYGNYPNTSYSSYLPLSLSCQTLITSVEMGSQTDSSASPYQTLQVLWTP